MMIEVIVTHDGKNWVAKNEFMSVAAQTIEILDTDVRKLVKQKVDCKAGENIRVFMLFDNSTIPQWMRQYAQHYFNRILEVDA